MESDSGDFLNVREAAKRLGVHENTIRNWANKGLIRFAQLPGSGFRRFSHEDIERMRREMFESYPPAITDEEPRVPCPRCGKLDRREHLPDLYLGSVCRDCGDELGVP